MPLSKHRRRRDHSVPGGRSATGTPLSVRPKKKKTNYLMLTVFVVIAILVIGSFGLTTIPFGRTGQARAGSSDKYVEGVGQQQSIMPTREHVDGKTVSYNTIPPTSGNHWSGPARCGFYEADQREETRDEIVVHNLEHGAIVISYNLATPEEVNQLRDVLSAIGLNQTWGVARFYDKIPEGTVAVAAWGVLDTMQGVDQNRIKKFFQTYAGRLGPETTQAGIGIPC